MFNREYGDVFFRDAKVGERPVCPIDLRAVLVDTSRGSPSWLRLLVKSYWFQPPGWRWEVVLLVH